MGVQLSAAGRVSLGYNPRVLRKVVTLTSALSLLLCAATVVLWVRSYSHVVDVKVVGRFTGISAYGSLGVFWRVPGGESEIDFYYWKSLLVFGVLPVAWLTWRLLLRRMPRDAHCPVCAYNLTGNVSGICPECGAAVVQSASVNPPGA